MRALLLMILTQLNACMVVEDGCYTNSYYAIEEANKFCRKGDGNRKLCESLEFDGKVCSIAEFHNNECLPLGLGIQKFIRIPYYECTKIKDKIKCNNEKACEWTIKDPIRLKYRDLMKWEPKP